jgi:hypothetical protein
MDKRPQALLLVFAFLLAPVCLPAQDDVPELTGELPDYTLAGEEELEETEGTEETEEPETPEKKKFRLKNRMVELSVLNMGLEFSNNFIATSDIIKSPLYMLGHISDIIQNPGLIWQDHIVIDLDRFFDGFNVNFGASIKPFSFNFNWKDKWGFGLDIAHIDITGNLSLPGNLVTLSEAVQDKFGVGAAVFVEVGVPVFFHYRDFKIKLRPAAYVPLIYTEPNITYTFTDTGNGTRFEINYDVQIYSLVSLEDTDALAQNLMDNARGIPQNNMGYDLGLSVEYPLLHNLDIGVDMVHIPVPFAAARLNHSMQLAGSVWMDTSQLNIEDLEDINDLDDLFGYPDDFTPVYHYNAAGKKIYRPFMMALYTHYRPFESRFLTLVPSIGFSINYLYPKAAAVEGGLTVRLDLVNMVIASLGVHYNDRRWKNSIDLILNFRALQFDVGVSLQSQNFVRSWQGAGMGINVGLKFGW